MLHEHTCWYRETYTLYLLYSINLFTLCELPKQRNPLNCLLTTFQNSTPNLTGDLIRRIYSRVIVCQHTKWVSRKTLYCRECLVWHIWEEHPQLETACCCNSFYNKAQKTKIPLNNVIQYSMNLSHCIQF